MTKRRIIATVAAGLLLSAVTAVGLAGCAPTTDAKSGPGQTAAKYVNLPDGGKVLCVFWVPTDMYGKANSDGSQISCDWGMVGK